MIKTVTHEEVTKEKLGGADTHNQISGVAHFTADSDEDCLATIRELLSFIPSNNLDDPPRVALRIDAVDVVRRQGEQRLSQLGLRVSF